MPKFKIIDWAGNDIGFLNRPTVYKSWDDAEDSLCEELGDNYESDRGEYYIVEVSRSESES